MVIILMNWKKFPISMLNDATKPNRMGHILIKDSD